MRKTLIFCSMILGLTLGVSACQGNQNYENQGETDGVPEMEENGQMNQNRTDTTNMGDTTNMMGTE
jgi:hypothetical protein